MRRVLITGDVHFQGYPYQFEVDEFQAVKEYVDIVKEFDVPCVLFVSGKFFEQYPEFTKEISKIKNIELGGHTYACFKDFWKGKGLVNKYLFGCNYGSEGYQARDIERFRKATYPLTITKWRTHEYASNANTWWILHQSGFKEIYDRFDICETPHISEELLNDVPITIWSDDIYLLPGKMSMEEWFEKSMALMKKQPFTVFQLHPSAMKHLDNFKTFRKVCKEVSSLLSN